MSFSFGFSGDDIEKDNDENVSPAATAHSSAPSAFPIPGKPQFPATRHELSDLLSQLPSKIAYGLLDVSLNEGDESSTRMQLPRRELWDVRVQLMAEDDEVIDGEDSVDDGGLGKHDVKTGIYEGGFKSWESSVDLVKVLAAQDPLAVVQEPTMLRVIELGCGTGLPSLALFTWMMQMDSRGQRRQRPCSFILADYNPSVLRLVTLPNFMLAWALQHQQTPALQDAFAIEGELELSPGVIEAFQQFLSDYGIDMSFISGAWSPQFIQVIYSLPAFAPDFATPPVTLLLGAETIYSPFALQAFTDVVFALLEKEQKVSGSKAEAFVAAKRLYFGVGGSLNDFIDIARARGGTVTELREETEGVRRGVVECVLPRHKNDSMEAALSHRG